MDPVDNLPSCFVIAPRPVAPPSKDAQASRKGKAAEHLVAAVAVLATGGELTVLTALVDDEGVDLSFKRRDGARTLDVQVKARFSGADGSKAAR